MIELAHVYKKECVEISGISQKYNLPVSAFDDILEQLAAAGYITHSDGSLLLQIEPDTISIWDIVDSINMKKISDKEVMESQTNMRPLRTPTSIMVDKEMEVVLHMIRYNFKRYKLSTWSEKASKMYI